jgi:voltage-gated potassium channel
MSTSIGDQKAGPYQMAILVLTVVILLGILADTCLTLPSEASRLVRFVDTLVCVFFLVDFGVRLYRAESKLAYLKWGWIDLLASIPNVELLRWGRLVRVLRIIRLLRGVRSVHKVIQMIFENRLQGGVISGALIAFLLAVFASVAVLVADQGADANIRTAEEALWWSVTTITTVGYGDKYPISTEGRLVGVLLMLCGVGLFGLLSGSVASMILGKREPESGELRRLLDKLSALEQKLDSGRAQDPRGGSEPDSGLARPVSGRVAESTSEPVTDPDPSGNR